MDFKQQIEDYEKGNLDTIARKRFEYALSQDKDLQEALTQFRSRDNSVPEASDFIPSRRHMLKTLGLALILAVGGVSVSNYFQKNTRIEVKRLSFEEVYIQPDLPEPANDPNHVLDYLKAYLRGDQSGLDSLSYKARTMNAPYLRYWTAELYFKERRIDSMLTYLPERFNTKDQDRIHYLEIMGYYFLGEDQLVKEAISRLPTSTERNYLLLYNKLIP